MKNLLLVSLALLATTPVMAQPAVSPNVPTEYILKVSPPELDVISEGLGTQPFTKVLPLMNKLRQQVIDQQPKPPEPKKD